MAYYLLDTDAVIDFLAGVTSSVNLIQTLHTRGDALCICDVVIAEVYSGLKPRDQAKAARLIASCTFLSTQPDDAKLAGQWRYEYARRGKSLSTTDVLIAATAYAHQAAIVSGNVDDYPMGDVDVLPLPRETR